MDWLCRHISCLWVIDAFSWVHNSAHEWFRCPKCGSGYQPWAEGKKDSHGRHIQLVQAQKVFTVDLATTVASIPGDLPEGTYAATGDHPELAEVRTEARKTGGQYKMYLCEWPDTDTTSLLNMFMEITAGLRQDICYKSDEDVLKEFKSMESRSVNPLFSQQVFSDEVRSHIDWINTCKKDSSRARPDDPKSGIWTYDHIATAGFMGVQYPCDPAEPVMSHKDIMRMLGLA